MTRLGVVRTVSYRPFDIDFFENISGYDVVLFHTLPHIETSLETIQLRTRSILPIDPTSIFKKKHNLISLASWTYLADLDQRLKEMDIDIISTIEPYFFLSRQCSRISKKIKKPLVITVAQNLPNHPSQFIPPYCWNSQEVISQADLFVAMTEKAKKYLSALSVPEEKIKVVYPGIDFQRFSPKTKTHSGTPRILFVGNLYQSKGLPELLEADAQLHRDGVDHELWVCGTGNLLPLLQEYATKYPIKYFGFVPHSKMPELYQSCDIFCLPSRDYEIAGIKIGEEQFGFVFLEAMACALPVISTNTGSIPEVLGTQNLLVPKRSVKQLYLALKYLITNEETRKVIAESNRLRVERIFDVKKQGIKFKEALDAINL